jgi:hypothetical protein
MIYDPIQHNPFELDSIFFTFLSYITHHEWHSHIPYDLEAASAEFFERMAAAQELSSGKRN